MAEESGTRYLDTSPDAKEERIIDVRSLRGSMKAFNDRLADYKMKAREVFKGVCDRCVRMDYNKGELKDTWEEYADELTQTRTHEVRHKKTGKLLGIMVDYVCLRGHGVSLEITGDEYKRYKEFNGVKEIVRRTGIDKAAATKAYHKHKGDIELATSEIFDGGKAKKKPEKKADKAPAEEKKPDGVIEVEGDEGTAKG